MRDEFLLDSLTSYLGLIEEYYCPVIIICDGHARRFVDIYSDKVESVCLAVEYENFFDAESNGKE